MFFLIFIIPELAEIFWYFFLIIIPLLSFITTINISVIFSKLLNKKGLIILIINMVMNLIFLSLFFRNIDLDDLLYNPFYCQIAFFISFTSVIFAVVTLVKLWIKHKKPKIER